MTEPDPRLPPARDADPGATDPSAPDLGPPEAVVADRSAEALEPTEPFVPWEPMAARTEPESWAPDVSEPVPDPDDAVTAPADRPVSSGMGLGVMVGIVVALLIIAAMAWLLILMPGTTLT
jgi:hypothetical protein